MEKVFLFILLLSIGISSFAADKASDECGETGEDCVTEKILNPAAFRSCVKSLKDLGSSSLPAAQYCSKEKNQNRSHLDRVGFCSDEVASLTGAKGVEYCMQLSSREVEKVLENSQCLEDLKIEFLDAQYFQNESVDKGSFILKSFLSYCEKPIKTRLSNKHFKFLGMRVYGNEMNFKETLIGGLSGLAYDKDQDSLLTISDDAGIRNHSRFYEINPDTRKFSDMKKLVTLVKGRKYNIDAEGIALLPDQQLAISSETPIPGSDVFIRTYDRNGLQQQEIHLPEKFLPSGIKFSLRNIFDRSEKGFKSNKALEALTSVPGAPILFTANEEPLIQDAIPGKRIVRIVKLAPNAFGKIVPKAEFAYPLEDIGDNGLVEMAGLDENRVLVLERRYDPSIKKVTAKIYEVNLLGAKDYSHVFSFAEEEKEKKIKTLKKKLLMDLDEILGELPTGLTVDNFEGMTLGPDLPNGKRTLILSTDNNFAARQFTQLLFLEFTP